MPLLKGKGQKVISANIKEMMDSWQQSGKIGNITPRSEAHALRIAQAAAYRQANVSRAAKTLTKKVTSERKMARKKRGRPKKRR